MSLSPPSSSMALLHGSIPGTSAVRLGFSTSASPSKVCLNVPVVKQGWRNSCRRRVLRAMVQETVLGSPSVYAREMERLSAKESLVLAVKLLSLLLTLNYLVDMWNMICLDLQFHSDFEIGSLLSSLSYAEDKWENFRWIVYWSAVIKILQITKEENFLKSRNEWPCFS